MTPDALLTTLDEIGVLLQTDATRPSVAGLVAGEGIRGAWWGHPRGNEIWQLLTALDHRPDVLFTRLVDGKVTLVAPRLFGAVFAVGQERAAWQLQGLTEAETQLLAQVEDGGSLVASGSWRVSGGQSPAPPEMKPMPPRTAKSTPRASAGSALPVEEEQPLVARMAASVVSKASVRWVRIRGPLPGVFVGETAHGRAV